jgi:hypothetical protein
MLEGGRSWLLNDNEIFGTKAGESSSCCVGG